MDWFINIPFPKNKHKTCFECIFICNRFFFFCCQGFYFYQQCCYFTLFLPQTISCYCFVRFFFCSLLSFVIRPIFLLIFYVFLSPSLFLSLSLFFSLFVSFWLYVRLCYSITSLTLALLIHIMSITRL